jgi:1-acyl-sn-glycerol-3-phosphate acyltransferase
MSEIPYINIDNYADVYRQYAEHPINQRTAQWGHTASGLLLRQQISWADGSEQTIGDHIENGGQVFLAAHHVSTWDVFELPSVLYREPALQPMMGNTLIAAKRALFKNALARRILNDLGAIPVLRQNQASENVSLRSDGVEDHNRKSIKQALKDTLVYRFNRIQHGAGTPLGTFAKPPRSNIGNLKPGLFEAILETDFPDRFAVLPVGIAYPNWACRPSGGRLHLGEPVWVQDWRHAGELTQAVSEKMQKAVEAAHS